MVRRGSFARQTPLDWAVRGGAALVIAILGWISVTFSIAQTLSNREPVTAHSLASYDGRITERLAAKLFIDTQATADDSVPARVARQALRQDPTAIDAVATLGVQAQARGDVAQARRLFAYATMLSRRNLQTQLWAIEDAVGRGDIPGALRQYDTALRTSKNAPDLLFPLLGAAIAEPAVRRNLTRTLSGEPNWAPAFMAYLAATPTDPAAMAALFVEMRQMGQKIPPAAVSTTVNALFEGGAIENAWRFYSAFRSGVDRNRSRDPRFTAMLEAPSLLDWIPVNDGSVSASIRRGTRSGIFEFTAPPSSGGVLIQQIQLLRPGNYRLIGHSADIAQPAGSLPYWTLTCRGSRELGRIVVPNSTRADGVFAGRFVVPADCPVQILALVARPSDEIGGLSGQIDRVQLGPVS